MPTNSRHCCRCQRHLKPECAPLTGVALNTDFTTHQLDYLLADGKAKPGAAKAPGNRAVRLREFFKQSSTNLCCHTRACVRNFETEICWSVAGCMGRDFYRDAAFLRKFD